MWAGECWAGDTRKEKKTHIGISAEKKKEKEKAGYAKVGCSAQPHGYLVRAS